MVPKLNAMVLSGTMMNSQGPSWILYNLSQSKIVVPRRAEMVKKKSALTTVTLGTTNFIQFLKNKS